MLGSDRPIFDRIFATLDRYILVELCLPFCFGMGLFTSLALSIGVIFDLVRRVGKSQITLSDALQMFALRMPEFIALAIPMSILLASLMVYSRLVNDSESIAMRASGIGIFRLVLPCLTASFLLVGVTFLINDFVAPEANYQATAILDRALDRVRLTYQRDNIIYPEYQTIIDDSGRKRSVLTRLFYAREFDGRAMYGLTVLARSGSSISQIVTSERGVWNDDRDGWQLFNGAIYNIDRQGTYQEVDRFDSQTFKLAKTPLNIALRGRKSNFMNILQARQYLQYLELGGDRKSVRQLQVNIQGRIAFPFICIVFAGVGAAIGLQPQNTAKTTSLGICILLIFGYYLFSFISSSLGVFGVLSPFMAAWLPDFLGFGAAALLLLKLSL